MRKVWRIKEIDADVRDHLASALNVSGVVASLLAGRGVTSPDEAKAFLGISLSSCHDPFLMKDMDKAVSRIRDAIASKEKILIYGDYDVDGMTSVALLLSAIKRLGADARSYIPSRIEEGYGLNMQAIKKVERMGAKLIITVDCGITSFKEIEFARTLGIDVIVTDHHEIVDGRVPEAFAVINSLQGSCSYPFKHLAGVGVAYKLVKALFDGTRHFAEDFLDLVSLGTVADVAPLVGENRTLTKYGLDELNRRERVGLAALMDVAGLGEKDISAGHIGFALGPRINAMGRVGAPDKAIELLLTGDKLEAARLAKMLDAENRNRQKIESKITDEAIARVEREVNFKHHKVIVLASEGWHPGVIGIVASRLVEKFYRPTILISLDGKLGKGSGRSVDDFHLFDYLFRCKDLLAGFGGHESACGVTIEKEKIDAFRDKINQEAAASFKDDSFSRKFDIDAEVSLSSFSEGVINELDMLAPFGAENPRPVLATKGLIVKDGPRAIGKNGFKMWVTDGEAVCEAVSFGRGNVCPPARGSRIDLAYIPTINNWQGIRSVQLEIKDIKPS